jgi:hypothetical protein
MMEKEDSQYYYNVSSNFFIEPKTMVPLLNSKLLVADLNMIAILNTEIYPPDSTSLLLNQTIELFEIGTPFGLALATQQL